MHNRRKRQRKKRFWQLLQALFLVLFAGIVAVIVLRVTDTDRRRAEESRAADQLAQLTATTEPPASPAPSAEISDEMQALLDQNPDFVGIVGLQDLAMYVCQGDDNSYYASHRLDGTEDPAGMIYMDFRCGADSENFILYGHNMRDGTRFGKLNRYENVDFLLENPTIQFSDLRGAREYRIFAVIRTHIDAERLEYFNFARPDFADQADFDRFVVDARALSMHYIPVAVERGDRLLTLATCAEDETGSRLVILCREKR